MSNTEVSDVVNRRPHPVHSRRRRIKVPSSAGRESTTLESSLRQNGQIIGISPYIPKYVREGDISVKPQLMEHKSRSTPRCCANRTPAVEGLKEPARRVAGEQCCN